MGIPAPFDEIRGVSLGRPGWTLLASSNLTGGAFELFEEVRPSPGGPPPHVHRDRDETFYVLEGRYAFTRGRRDRGRARAGGLRATGHAPQLPDPGGPVADLIVIAPAGLAQFFREMGVRIGAGATPLEAMTALSEWHDAHPVP